MPMDKLNNLLSRSWNIFLKAFFSSALFYNIHFISAFFMNSPG